MSIHEQQNGRLSDGKACHPEQDPPARRSQPQKKTQRGNHSAEKIGAKMKLSAAQPLKLIRVLSRRNGFGTPDHWGNIKTALLTGIVREQRSLPNAHSQDALLHFSKVKGLHRLRNIPDRARWQLAVTPDERAVPIDFVWIVDIGHQERKLLGHASSSRGSIERDRTPVPGKTCEVRMPLLTPRLVRAELLPVRAIERG